MLDLKRVTLFAIHVAWDKSKIAAEDFQDGEEAKTIDDGFEGTLKELFSCIESCEFGSV